MLRTGYRLQAARRGSRGVSLGRQYPFQTTLYFSAWVGLHAGAIRKALTTDTVDVGLVLAMDVVQCDAIVELLLLLVREVAETIPCTSSQVISSIPLGWGERAKKQRTLATALGVEGPGVVIDDARMLLVYVLVEGLTAEEAQRRLRVERPVQRDSRRGREESCKKLLSCFSAHPR